jgi:Flp pilus assembly protein TadG
MPASPVIDHLPALAGCLAGALLCLRTWRALPLGTALPGARDLAERKESGTAMLDFVLTFPFFVMIVLIVIQFALMVNARIVVSWAAFAGARSAIVWTDDGLEVAKKRAQRAAAVACTAISPRPAFSIPFTDVGAELLVAHGKTNVLHRLARVSGMHRYALAATDVEVKAGSEKGEIGPHDPVTVTVTYQFHLAVPYADGVFSRAFGGPRFGGLVMPIRETYTLTNEGKVHTEGGDPAKCHYFNLSVTEIWNALRRLS